MLKRSLLPMAFVLASWPLRAYPQAHLDAPPATQTIREKTADDDW